MSLNLSDNKKEIITTTIDKYVIKEIKITPYLDGVNYNTIQLSIKVDKGNGDYPNFNLIKSETIILQNEDALPIINLFGDYDSLIQNIDNQLKSKGLV